MNKMCLRSTTALSLNENGKCRGRNKLFSFHFISDTCHCDLSLQIWQSPHFPFLTHIHFRHNASQVQIIVLLFGMIPPSDVNNTHRKSFAWAPPPTTFSDWYHGFPLASLTSSVDLPVGSPFQQWIYSSILAYTLLIPTLQTPYNRSQLGPFHTFHRETILIDIRPHKTFTASSTITISI